MSTTTSSQTIDIPLFHDIWTRGTSGSELQKFLKTKWGLQEPDKQHLDGEQSQHDHHGNFRINGGRSPSSEQEAFPEIYCGPSGSWNHGQGIYLMGGANNRMNQDLAIGHLPILEALVPGGVDGFYSNLNRLPPLGLP